MSERDKSARLLQRGKELLEGATALGAAGLALASWPEPSTTSMATKRPHSGRSSKSDYAPRVGTAKSG